LKWLENGNSTRNIKNKNFIQNWNRAKFLWFSLNGKKYCHFNRTECQYGFHEHISRKLEDLKDQGLKEGKG
jgi:hypothetical protein